MTTSWTPAVALDLPAITKVTSLFASVANSLRRGFATRTLRGLKVSMNPTSIEHAMGDKYDAKLKAPWNQSGGIMRE